MLDSLNIWQYPGSPSRPNGLPLGRIGNPYSMDLPKKQFFVWLAGLPGNIKKKTILISGNLGGVDLTSIFVKWVETTN